MCAYRYEHIDIRLDIEEIVLYGFSDQKYRYNIADAIEKELAKIIQEKGLSFNNMNGGERERRDAKEDSKFLYNVKNTSGQSFEILPDSKPELVGYKIASSIYQGLNNNKNPVNNKNDKIKAN